MSDTESYSDQPSIWPEFLPPDAIEQFAQAGWTPEDWTDLDREGREFSINPGPSGGTLREVFTMAQWLRDPPEYPLRGISPGTVAEAMDVFGTRAPRVLDAYADGASRRFVAAFLDRYPSEAPVSGWRAARWCDLAEPAALGWLMTGLLYGETDSDGVPWTYPQSRAGIGPWVDRFGSRAYLWVLAGFTLDEALNVSDAGGVTDEEQLRVMVALAGVVLPAGV